MSSFTGFILGARLESEGSRRLAGSLFALYRFQFAGRGMSKLSDIAPPDPRAAALAGAVSGTAAVAATYPLDLIRTRQALDRRIPPRSTFSALRSVCKDEGFSALFRGLRPAVLSHAPAAAIFFTVYTRAQQRVPVPTDTGKYAVSAASAWMFTCLCMNPLWVVKTRFQAQATGVRVERGSLRYGRVSDTLRIVYREQGLRGLYRGLGAAMAGTPAAAIQLPFYESIKRGGFVDGGELPSPTRIAVASAASAAAVSIIAFPSEVVRLRMQAQEMRGADTGRQMPSDRPQPRKYSGVVDAFRTIFREEGAFALYRGLSASLIRTVPNSAIGLLTFETLLRSTSLFFASLDGALGDSPSLPGSVDK